MGIFNEHGSNSKSDISSTGNQGPLGPQGPSGPGFKLTDTGDYDLQNKKNC